MRSSRQRRYLVGVSGQAMSGHGVPRLLVAAVPPPVAEELAGRRDHPRDEDEQLGWEARTHERCREAAEGVADDNQIAPISDCVDDRVRIVPPTGGVVLGGLVDADRVVAALSELGSDEVPVPGTSAAAMDERERRHAQRSTMRNRMTRIDALTL
jgi:hypothetical protein